MAWTWQEIETQWLTGSRVAIPPTEIVEAFNRAEEALGREWVKSHRVQGGAATTGAIPVLAVASMGKRLQALRAATGLASVIQRIRAGDRSARAELTAAYLCSRSGGPEIEFAAAVQVGRRERVPDFRLRMNGEPWTYVEVTAPDVSELQQQATAVLDRMAQLLPRMPVGSVAEVMLRCDPTEDEIILIQEKLLSLLDQTGPATADLPDLALVLTGRGAPGQIVLKGHGEPSLPRIGMARVEADASGPQKHIAIRYPYADKRAESFLTSEARQLPKDDAGLVMVDISQVTSAVESWVPLLQRRLQPNQHTRVSAVVLFSGGMWATTDGEAWIPFTKVMVNPFATTPVPPWLLAQLQAWRPPKGVGI